MWRWFFISTLALLMFSGCKSMSLVKTSGTAKLVAISGSSVSGNVQFVQRGENKVLIQAEVFGLSPGMHGFHIHEKGDCRAADGSSAGGHFNPSGAAHGGPENSTHHLGDLGNLSADSNGHAVYSAEILGLTLGTDANSIIGRSLIVHAGPDDLTSQPSGASGARIACGLISKNPDKIF